MCWAACDRLAKIAAHLALHDRAVFWRDRADRMHARIDELAFDPERGGFVEGTHSGRMDAVLLLLVDLGFVRANDPRFAATVEAVGRELRRGDGMLRYVAPDDFGVPETSFTICTFWYIDALAAVGRRDEARELFERVLARRNHVGLLSEDMSLEGNELWGNFPQTYSHVGLINAAMRLSRPWEDAT
jgi:GH15 family glucan-1,4-alpha-glucosidase